MKPAGNVQSKAFLYFRFFYSRFIFSHLFCQDSLVAEAAKSATAAAREPAEDVAEAVEDHNGEEAKEEELPLEQDDVMDATWLMTRAIKAEKKIAPMPTISILAELMMFFLENESFGSGRQSRSLHVGHHHQRVTTQNEKQCWVRLFTNTFSES